ncbi:MAG: HAMP domain-containing histidine kinase [Oscillospiraceae bacterium]|nr:HAMP domain-containing histidine kinase [Oscillospiraceae bacterium]
MSVTKVRRPLYFLRIFCTFFLLISFVLTSSMILFLTYINQSTGLELTQQNIGLAALMTFGNVFMLSLVCALADMLRRYLTIERPIRRIAEGAENIMAGDFSTRIVSVKGFDSVDGFNEIIDCFNRMAEELGGMETLRTDFIANVSHELKTPLAVIQNYATMLQQPGITDEERKEYGQTIGNASRRLADMITNILKLNKLENQQIYPDKRKYDLSEQLCECLLAFENAWEAKELEIETDIEDGVMVESDPELLSLVWNNLFSNAIKFTEPGGTVSLALHSEGDHAVIAVSDTGCGISSEVGEHIFEKFYQGDTSHATQGNGLGLALVKRVVDIVGGEITVSSEVGVGSTFTVKLRRTRA